MAVPVPRTWVASETIDASKLNNGRDAQNFLLEPPRAYGYKTADGALTSGVWDAINLGAEAYDSHAAHDNATNNTRLVAPESGLYTIKAHGVWDTNSSGLRGLDIRKNANAVQTGGTDLVWEMIAGNGTTQARMGVTVDIQLVAGDYIELFAYQNSGGPLNILGGIAQTFLSFRWVAKTA